MKSINYPPTVLLAILLIGGCTGAEATSSESDGGTAASTTDTGESGSETGAMTETGTDTESGSESESETGEPGDVSTANVLCGFQGEGSQELVYTHFNPMMGTSTPVDETLPYNFAWVCDDKERMLSANGIPNHGVVGGNFASLVSAQDISLAVTLEPAVIDEITNVKEPGYALNGVKFDPGTAGTCPDNATVDTDCDYGMGSDTWSMVATPGNVSPWRFDFGVDENDAHVQPTGHYHYHGNPVRLVDQLNPSFQSSMTLVGWATDGFPIYSLYGHADPGDGASDMVKMQSSYQTVETPAAGRPSVEDFPLGHFSQDWEYVEGSGMLDECNGRFAVTPEFPAGIYHYYITDTFPFVQRCVKGTSTGPVGPPPPP